MLAFSFFAIVFSSLLWVIYSLKHVIDILGAGGFSNAGISDIAIYAAFVLLPVFGIWVVFGIISQYLNNQAFNKNLQGLFRQMKKNQDYSDLIARVMLEERQQFKDGFIMQQFDLFVSDLNELIAEIIQRTSLASNEQIDHLWSKVKNGGKWAFGKVIIEINHNQPSFQMRVYDRAREDKVLAGTILEFCAKYQNVVSLFEKHDKDKIFLGTIENGVMGKVFFIMSPICEEIRKSREAAATLAPKEVFHSEPVYQPQKAAPMSQKAPRASALSTRESLGERQQVSVLEKPRVKFRFLSVLERLGMGKKEKQSLAYAPEVKEEVDPLALALERSFGTPAKEEPSFSAVFEEEVEIRTEEPEFSISMPESDAEEISVAREVKKAERPQQVDMSHTQKTLDTLRKEWDEMKKEESPVRTNDKVVKSSEDDDDAIYPFGSWANEENYHK